MNNAFLRASIGLAAALALAGPTTAQQLSVLNGGGVCTLASLRGSFGFTSTGTLLVPAVPPPFVGPFAEAGIQTFDGRGNTTGTATISANGNIFRNAAISGTYTVKTDCTGSMTLVVPDVGATVHLDFVIDAGKGEIQSVSSDAGAVESRIYKKQ